MFSATIPEKSGDPAAPKYDYMIKFKAVCMCGKGKHDQLFKSYERFYRLP